MNTKVLLFTVALIAFGVVAYLTYDELYAPTPEDENVACTMDAMMCPDGSSVGRVPPLCEFAACPEVENQEPALPRDIQEHIDSRADLIKLETPAPYTRIESPLTLSGVARGNWFFEATFPIILVNWDGLIIAEGYATADGEWMTTEFVPWSATLTFTTPDFDERGYLILQKSNPSGLPLHDDALEIPILFNN